MEIRGPTCKVRKGERRGEKGKEGEGVNEAEKKRGKEREGDDTGKGRRMEAKPLPIHISDYAYATVS